MDKQVGHYRVLSLIGAGGMGEVYLAEDTRLGRKVALKILPPNIASDVDRLRRFEQEARAASALNHPNILTVYEFGAEAGVRYLAMEFVEGETLKAKLSRDELGLTEVVGIAEHVALALSAAHSAGIVHRDVKPENIMLRDADGIVKVLDFGLAKLTQTEPPASAAAATSDPEAETRALLKTSPGMVMGTMAYMSPEQTRGKETDERTDIFSLGVVLYEMLTGRLPFAGETASDVIAAILTSRPAPPGNFAPGIPAELERAVLKCLAKDRDERYQSARDLLADLRRVKRQLDLGEEIERTKPPHDGAAGKEDATRIFPAPPPATSAEYVVGKVKKHKLGFAVALLALLLAVGGGLAFWYPDDPAPDAAPQTSTAPPIESIAVLPFRNESGNPEMEYLSDGLAETLIYRLSQIPNLKVSPTSSVFRFKGKEMLPGRIGRELEVGAVLDGRIRRFGDNLIINAELVDVKNNKLLWVGQYDSKDSDLLTTQRDIARQIADNLEVKVSGDEPRGITRRYTENNEAYQLYLKGRFHWNRRTEEDLKKAIQEFREASEKDPNFALAYVGLADCYVLLEQTAGTPAGDALPKAKAYARRALEIDEALPEAHASLGIINDSLWQWEEAEREFRRALELNPDYPTAHHWYAIHLRHLGRFDEAFAEIMRAQELDPLSSAINSNVVTAYLMKNDEETAVEQAKKMIELNPNDFNGYLYLGRAYLKQGRHDEGLAEIQKANQLTKRILSLSHLGHAYALAGKRAEALAVIKELEAKHSRQEAIGQHLAIIYAGLGDRERALAWLEKDFQARSGRLSFTRWYYEFDPLRDDPRYADLLRRMGLPQ